LDGYLDGNKDRAGCKDDGSEEVCDVCRGIDEQLDEAGASEGEAGEDSDREQGGELEGDSDRAPVEDDSSDSSDGSDTLSAAAAEKEDTRRVFRQQEQERRAPWRALREQRQQEFTDVEWVRRQLAQWVDRCGVCVAAGSTDCMHHVQQCWRAGSVEAKIFVKTIDKEIRFEDWSGCFTCGGIPQEICSRWEPNGTGRYRQAEGRDCQYSKGALSGALIGVIVGYGLQRRWMERLRGFGVSTAEDDEGMSVVEYLGLKQKLDTAECNNMVKEFCWATRLVAEETRV